MMHIIFREIVANGRLPSGKVDWWWEGLNPALHNEKPCCRPLDHRPSKAQLMENQVCMRNL